MPPHGRQSRARAEPAFPTRPLRPTKPATRSIQVSRARPRETCCSPAEVWAAGLPSARRRPDGLARDQTGGRADGRCRTCVNGVDDLGVVDHLQIDRGDPEVRVPELPLDDNERDAFVRHLDRVRVAELWGANRRRTPAASAVRCSCLRAAEDSQCRPAVGPWMTQSSAPTGRFGRSSSHGLSCCHAHLSIPTSRRLPPFPRRTRMAPRDRSRSVSASARASPILSPARHSSTIRARRRIPSRLLPAACMTATTSSVVGGSAGHRSPCCAGPALVVARHRCR